MKTRHCQVLRPRRFLAATATLLLGACSLGPRYTRPDVAVPSSWRPAEQAVVADPSGAASEPPGGGPSTPATGATWPSADWWQGFQSPQLNALIAEAQSANDDIGGAIARVREADAQARIAGAPLLPSIAIAADATRQQQIITSGQGNTGSTGARASSSSNSRTYNLFGTTSGASYEIDFWGKNRALRSAAQLAATGSRYDRATVELTVLTGVASTYFQVLELRDRLRVAADNLTAAQTILDGLTLEAKVGTATALDVAQQEATVAALRAAVPPLRRQLNQTMDALAILVGKTPQDLQVATGTLAQLSQPQVQPGVPSELLTRRPDVAAAEAQLAAANANVAAARAAFFPSINLTADGGFASTALATLFNPASRVFAMTAGITQPIFQGGALSGQYTLSKARYDELVSTYHKAVISAFADVHDAVVALQLTSEQQQREEEAVSKARRAYEFSQTQLHAGTVNILTVLNTENALFSAEDTLVQARFSHLQALVALYGALGGGWQRG